MKENYFDNADEYYEHQEMLQEINSFLSDCLQQTEEHGAVGASPASMSDDLLRRADKVCAYWKSAPDIYPGLAEVFACMEDLASQKIKNANQSSLIRAIMQIPGAVETRAVLSKANLWILRVEDEIYYRKESREVLSDEDLANNHAGSC